MSEKCHLRSIVGCKMRNGAPQNRYHSRQIRRQPGQFLIMAAESRLRLHSGSLELMTSSEQEGWRKAFEMIGPDQLRLRLEARRDEFPPQYARAAEAWILQQDAKKAALEASRYRKILGWTMAGFFVALVAALAAAISAIPVVRDFFK